ncbi:pilus assembly protein [Polynucleobacter sp. AP-Kolm-20A-A1]|uniref:pilus assembly protein n=1 Tax=Polynucleobacter sp. AP-Kolm-20A-A1 TaxID=2081041 RepID=UPI001BFDC1F8|nr:PilC/PilY family type IV pilus protein [Polynucleobacter sp. AP-Kolm-20A-A1]QWE21459.1 hypothetical protein C2745_04580 [Polynucleobacter sp. AP-Kolm-20A-A1]
MIHNACLLQSKAFAKALKAITISGLLLLPTVEVLAQCVPGSFGIIHNSLASTEQTIMLGVNRAGNLNTSDGCGTAQTNSQNQSKFTDGRTMSGANSGSVGISYYWQGAQKRDPNTGALVAGKYYPQGWYDSTSQGKKWESWSAGAMDNTNQEAWASISQQIGQGNATSKTTMVVKSFTVDTTSVQSKVIINDRSGVPMLEVSHIYGPTSGATNKSLFQGLVTITNISGGTLRDVRYRRSMDWDVIENMTNAYVNAVGVRSSYLGTYYPKIWSYCDNGGEDDIHANPFAACSPNDSRSLNNDYTGLHGQTGSSFDFQFGDLACNESATFYIYYGASDAQATLTMSMAAVGVTTYSMGYDPLYPSLVYAFGFKGVSGTAVAPALPTKVASLPAGSSTDSRVWQTYASPVLGNGVIYQALFKYQKDKQWAGEIMRYKLDDSGAITADPPVLASDKLKTRAASSQSAAFGGRSIWTVGYDRACMSSGLTYDLNNFNLGNSDTLISLLFNCPLNPDTNANKDLINFTRGLNTDWEENAPVSSVRSSVLGDTYHSEMILVGAPNALSIKDAVKFGKSEAYYRYSKGYDSFIAKWKDRRQQLYVGSNDGMLHAFDADLNEQWAFIPPSVLPILRNMTGTKGVGAAGGTSNSIFSVDGPISVKDIYSEGVWKTILMGGLGWGGNSYYALDITDPDAPKHLFTVNNDVANKTINYWNASGEKSTFAYNANCRNFDYSKLGGAWSRPVIMLMPYGKTQRWVAAFGGGYSGGASVTGTGSTSSFGGYVYVVDLEPNAGVTTASCGATGNGIVASTGGHVIINTPLLNDTNSNIPNGVTAHLTVVNGDGTALANYYGGLAYFTDLQGQLWKFNLSQDDLSDAGAVNLFTLYKSFRSEATLANDRMGFNQLGTTIVEDKTTAGITKYPLFNYFGTGDQVRIQRRASTINNRIYGVIDSTFPKSTLDLSNQTVVAPSPGFTDIKSGSTCAANQSWYADVWARTNQTAANDYQKIIGRAAVYNRNVYFSAYQPEAKDCPLYGKSRIIEISESCAGSGISGETGPGLATAPTVDGKGNIYVGMSNMPFNSTLPSGRDNIAKLTSSKASPTGKVQYKSWREKRVY